jgi:hypothetical protein
LNEHGPHEQLPGLLDGVNATLVGGPSVALAPAAGAPSLNAFGAIASLVKFNVDIAHHTHHLKLGRVPLVLTASTFVQQGTGPVVGVCRFGSGNGSQQSFEFDVQQGFPLFTVPNITNSATAGGSLFSLPCTSIEINARNDANLLANAGGDPLGLVAGAAVPLASASIGIGNRGSSKPLTRTVYGIYAPASVGGRLAPAGIVQVSVPAFAKRFRTFRTDATQPISVALTDGTGTPFDGPYNEAANAPPATYDLPASCSSVVITNTGAAALKVVGCVFELGL